LLSQKNNPWIKKFNKEIKKFVSSGLMVHWRSKFWPPDDACSLKTDGDITVKPVNVMDMTGIFFILGCGFVLSALLLMFEFCMRSLKPNLDSENGGNRTPVTPFTM